MRSAKGCWGTQTRACWLSECRNPRRSASIHEARRRCWNAASDNLIQSGNRGNEFRSIHIGLWRQNIFHCWSFWTDGTRNEREASCLLRVNVIAEAYGPVRTGCSYSNNLLPHLHDQNQGWSKLWASLRLYGQGVSHSIACHQFEPIHPELCLT